MIKLSFPVPISRVGETQQDLQAKLKMLFIFMLREVSYMSSFFYLSASHLQTVGEIIKKKHISLIK